MRKTVAEIARLVGGDLIGGNGSGYVKSVAPIEEAGVEDITFAAQRRYFTYLKQSKAAAAIVPRSVSKAAIPIIQVDDPYQAFLKVQSLFAPPPPVYEPGIHPTCVYGEGTTFGEDVSVQPYVVIGRNVRIHPGVTILAGTIIGDDCVIGADTFIHASVLLRERVIVGARVLIHGGAVVGCDGFGFLKSKRGYLKIPQRGNVIIEDDVEIGANVTIDRATVGSTRIGRGTKIDNLVHIGHNVVIGAHCTISAQVGISGSTKIDHDVTVGGQAGFTDHITVGHHATLGGQAGVTKSVPPHTVASGYPARPHQEAKRIEACISRLPRMVKVVRELQKRLGVLEEKIRRLSAE